MLFRSISTLFFSLLLVPILALAFLAWLISAVNQPDEQPTGISNLLTKASTSLLKSFPRRLSSSTLATSSGPLGLVATNAFPNLTFEAPIEFTYANDGSNRVYVVEQAGRIKSFDKSASAKEAAVILDIRKQVAYGGEMGLLGLAFHPEFKKNGFFFVDYTKDHPRETVVSRFKMTNGVADPASETILFTFAQPYSNHNGGKVAFGPDGYLYIATGDGGSGGDPRNNGQNKSAWLGKILRVDVNSTEKGNYGIPADNPFRGQPGLREEIFAYGLRNPWRFSFDAKTGQLWTGDVGQNKIEEVDIITRGGNYGWRIREANAVYDANAQADTPLIDPIHEYAHGADGNSITGGYVYRGTSNAALQGKYIYGDFGSGRVWALSQENGKKTSNQLLLDRAGSISSFGEDQQHELYICDYGDGKILKLSGQ